METSEALRLLNSDNRTLVNFNSQANNVVKNDSDVKLLGGDQPQTPHEMDARLIIGNESYAKGMNQTNMQVRKNSKTKKD